MKVKCVKLFDDRGQEIASSPWASKGAIYHVLAISIDSAGKRLFRVLTRENAGQWPQVVLLEAECFEVVSTVVPSSWTIEIAKSSAMEIAPATWQSVSFLEDFYNHDDAALLTFDYERKRILDEDP